MNFSACNWFKILVVLISLYILGQVTPVFLPILISMVLAFILTPVVDFLCRIPVWPGRSGIPRGLAILLSFILLAAVVSVVLSVVFLPLIGEFNKFVIDLPALIARVQHLTMVIGERTNAATIPDSVRNLFDQGLSSAASFSLSVVRHALNALLGLATQVVELVVVPVLTYYFLKDAHLIRDGMISVFNPPLRPKVAVILGEMAQVLSAYIRGQAIVSLIIGLLVFGGIYLMGIEYPLVIALLAAITETIPTIGPIIGAIPAIILAYLISPGAAVKVMAFYVIIHQLENHIIVPNIMGHTIHLHPVVVIVSLLVGGQLYGIAGMILAVPVVAILKVLMKHLWHSGERW